MGDIYYRNRDCVPEPVFFSPSPKSDYTVSAIKIYFVLFFYKVNLEKRLEHFFVC